MAVAVHGVGAVHHLLAQEIQLPDADPAMMPTPPREPASGPQEPRAEGEETNHRHGHGRVVEGLRCDWVVGRETEHDGEDCDPETRNNGEWLGCGAESERSAFDFLRVEDGHGDGDAVGDVQADGGDGRRAVEGDFGA